jgi:hypothetical protein
MSFFRHAAIGFVSSLALAGLAGSAITACSSSSPAGDDPQDASAKPRPDSGSVDAASPDASAEPPPDSGPVDASSDANAPDSGLTAAQCYQNCLDAHPTAKAPYSAVDQCWVQRCQGPCLDQTGTFDASAADGGDAGTFDAGGDAGGLCGTDVGSGGDTACDQCTTAFCCAEWDSCYGVNHDECLAIDDCLSQCP